MGRYSVILVQFSAQAVHLHEDFSYSVVEFGHLAVDVGKLVGRTRLDSTSPSCYSTGCCISIGCAGSLETRTSISICKGLDHLEPQVLHGLRVRTKPFSQTVDALVQGLQPNRLFIWSSVTLRLSA